MNIIDKNVRLIFNALIRVATLNFFYYIAGFFVHGFYKYIFLNIYNFIKLYLSRNIEYRCDVEGAYACGGANMARALNCLGEIGYISLFSTHPKTKNRVHKVRRISAKNGLVSRSFINSCSNFLAIFILLFTLLASYQQVNKMNIDLAAFEILQTQYYNYKNTLAIQIKILINNL